MKIAFIGLGNMGGPMAHNLHKAGHEVRAFDLSQPARDKLAADGVPIAADAKAAVQGAEVVISMLPASQHVEGLFLGAGDLLAQLPAGTLVIDCSTIAAATSRKVADAAQAKGVAFIDAPVSGGTGGAIAGTLTFMVGGDTADLERARPILEKMGANIFHAGSVGAGQTAKICNNMLLGILMAGTSEAIALGVANGLGPQGAERNHAPQLGRQLGAREVQPLPRRDGNRTRQQGLCGGFGTDLMLKDLGLAQENAMAVKAATPLGAWRAICMRCTAWRGMGGWIFQHY